MKNLVKAEFFKLFRSRTLWLLLAFALVTGAVFGISPLTGYEICMVKLSPELSDVIWISVFAVSFVCGEFSDRTFGRSILCMASRQKIFFAKAFAFFTGTLPILFLSVVAAAVTASARNGFGQGWNTVILSAMMQHMVLYILWVLFMDTCALLTAVSIQDKIGTFGAGLAFMYIMMSLEAGGTGKSFGIAVAAYVVKITVMVMAAALAFAKKDLK